MLILILIFFNQCELKLLRYNGDERDLQLKICKRLNRGGKYQFKREQANYFCDVVEPIRHIYTEVKTSGYAPEQILYGLVKANKINVQYVGIANAYELRLYKAPRWTEIEQFGRKISSNLTLAPSNVPRRFRDEAFKLLGEHVLIYDYKVDLDLDLDNLEKFIFIDDYNYEYLLSIFTKYGIDPIEFLKKFTNIFTENGRLVVKPDGSAIVDVQSLKMVLATRRKIKDKYHIGLIEHIRIKGADINKILRKIESLVPRDLRAPEGRFNSEEEIGKYFAKIIKEKINPDFIFEPYVGTGSLIRPFAGSVEAILNDIVENLINILEQEFKNINWHFKAEDFIITDINEIMNNWNPSSQAQRFLIYSNPPYSTASKTEIEYGGLDITYGRGDKVLPATGKMIEVIRERNNGFLAFFCPFGVFCRRKRYNKLLDELLKDFKFIFGEVFTAGNSFPDVNPDKLIAFSIWEYNQNYNTDHTTISFQYEGQNYRFIKMDLLKDGWDYDNRRTIDEDAIAIQGNDRFNVPYPKNFKINVKSGGSQIVGNNVKKPLPLPPEVPSELAYGLWSSFIGYHAFIPHPPYMSDAYIHLPDFEMEESREILAYLVIYNLITELMHNHTNNKIGFVSVHRLFEFGGGSLTQGAKYLINTYKDCPIRSSTIESVFNELKNTPNIDNLQEDYRKYIKTHIIERLEDIGYWDYIPIP